MVVYQECLIDSGSPTSEDEVLRVGRKCARKMKQEYAKIEDPDHREAMVRSIDLTLNHQECMHRGMRAERMALEDALLRGTELPDTTPGMNRAVQKCREELERELEELKRLHTTG